MLYIKPTDEVLSGIDTYEDLYKLLSTNPEVSPEVFKIQVDSFRALLMKKFPDKTIHEIMSMIDTYNETQYLMKELYDYRNHNNLLTVIDFELRKNLNN
jgi:hypothetical protein